MSTADVDDVATDLDITDEIGEVPFGRLARDSSDGQKARQRALDDVLDKLRNRVPPIRETDLSDISELRFVVVYGAVARLYRSSMTTGDGSDVNSAKFQFYNKQYERRSDELRPTVTGNRIAAPASIKLNRA